MLKYVIEKSQIPKGTLHSTLYADVKCKRFVNIYIYNLVQRTEKTA
jgi:hypothetical protein